MWFQKRKQFHTKGDQGKEEGATLWRDTGKVSWGPVNSLTRRLWRFDDIDAEDMVITHVAAHRGQVATNMRPRARGRATPSNHYQVNLEIFLEYFDEDEVLEQEDEDF
jgi:hypothetical protein